jgi:hypothetical protein
MESIKKLDSTFVHPDVITFYVKNKNFDINYCIEIFNKTKKKYFITHSFSDSIHKAENKIMDFAQKKGMIDFVKDFEDESAIFFFDGGWILYEIKDKQHTIFWFNKNILRGSCYIINDNLYGCFEDTDSTLYFVRGFLTTLWFIRNCDIEQKVIKPQEKFRENGNKHYNESKSELIILDCRWFTELIRDIPFLVKGHFRWQPVGEGRTQKKLIWIEDFKKEGYHRKATKLI